MRLYHKDHGFHFLSDNKEIAAFKENGWVEAPKGYQKTLDQPAKKNQSNDFKNDLHAMHDRIKEINTAQPQRKKPGPKPKAAQ